MSGFDNRMVFDQPSDSRKDYYTKKGPHYAPIQRPVAGGYLMALGLLAAYRTVQSDFNVHRLTTQFFRPGAKQKTIAFEVMRSSDANNNAARIVFVSQESIRLAIVTVDFIRRPILDGLSLNYQPRFPEGIETPDDKLDSLKFLGKGFVHGYSLPRIMRPDSDNIEDNKTRQWVKCSRISSDTGSPMHHAGLAFLSDTFTLDSIARLHNLQLGFGESKVGSSQEDSPYDTIHSLTDPRTARPSDLQVMVTLNHTIHFYHPGSAKVDDWLLLDVATSVGHGGRALAHSKFFSQDGTLLAVCTQECYIRLKKGAAPQKILRTKL